MESSQVLTVIGLAVFFFILDRMLSARHAPSCAAAASPAGRHRDAVGLGVRWLSIPDQRKAEQNPDPFGRLLPTRAHQSQQWSPLSLDENTYRSTFIAAKPDAVFECGSKGLVIEVKTRLFRTTNLQDDLWWQDVVQLIISSMVVFEHQGWENMTMVLRYANAEVKLRVTDRALRNLYALGKSAAALEMGARASATSVAEMAVALRHRPKKQGSKAAREHGEQVHRQLLRKRRRR